MSILTTAGAAEILGYSPATVVRACDAGKLKCFRTPGGHRRIYLSDLRDYIAAKEADPNDYIGR